MGFGLGLLVSRTAAASKILSSPGEFAWWRGQHRLLGGPGGGIRAMFFTQLLPSSNHPIRSPAADLVYQAGWWTDAIALVIKVLVTAVGALGVHRFLGRRYPRSAGSDRATRIGYIDRGRG